MTVLENDFEGQMRYLEKNGYRVITLDQFFGFLNGKTQIPEKSVVITIDDGWRSVYDVAFPILKKYGYPATLFVYTDLITGSPKTLNWKHINEMAENGIDIQCHSKTHRNFNVRDAEESFEEYFQNLEKELTESAKVIKKYAGKDVKYLAYPYGDSNPLVIALLKKLGYLGAFTVQRQSNPFFVNNFQIGRSMIYGSFNDKAFEKNLGIFSDKALR
jgi:peptidoglycan/xylan/chitin deacetylase (PgdA/CDA1 family)